MLLTANQTAQLTTTYRSAIAAVKLVYSTTTLVNQYFILPAIDHLYGNACDWQETLIKGWNACKPVLLRDSARGYAVLSDIVLMIYLICKLVIEKSDAYIESCLEQTAESTGLQEVEATGEVTQAMIDHDLAELEILVNQLSEVPEYATLESTGLQYFEPYTEPQADSVDVLEAPTPKRRKTSAKVAIVEVLLQKHV
jgi:hypothetical protein